MGIPCSLFVVPGVDWLVGFVVFDVAFEHGL